MRESNVRQKICRWLREAGLDASPVENSACPGYPDIEYIGGTIEIKYLSAWPRRERTNVQVPKFSPQQRIWLRRRHRAGGLAFLLLVVGEDWLLFDGETAANYLGIRSREELGGLAKHAMTRPDRSWLVSVLGGPMRPHE